MQRTLKTVLVLFALTCGFLSTAQNVKSSDGKVEVVQTPQGRNGMPNPNYVNNHTGETGFLPVGAVGAPELGQRCEGNSNCVPICPVQAKYNALKSLQDALKHSTAPAC